MYHRIVYITLTLLLIVFSSLIICLFIPMNVSKAENEAIMSKAVPDGPRRRRVRRDSVDKFDSSTDLVEIGTATWISNSLYGEVTASGEKYNNHSLVAAHHSLPFGTFVKVTNLENNQFVMVKINDRKPYSDTNVIVVSWEAAQQLHLIKRGRAEVKIEVLSGRYGIASWYGSDFDGNLTANGEIYNMNKLTAAHKELPFNTRVRVTNLNNGKSVVVRINDRGPFVEDRIIDLSKEAARMIDMVDSGVSMVKLNVLGQYENSDSQ